MIGDQTVLDNLAQVRLEALSAVFLHQKRIKRFRSQIILVELYLLLVLFLYLFEPSISPNSEYIHSMNLILKILIGLLIILTIIKSLYRWNHKLQMHTFMAYKNRDTAREALELLGEDRISKEVVEQFLKRVQDNDKYDNDDLFINVKLKEDQLAYRYALKHLFPGKTASCPKCKADPWIFHPGECQLCGNTPLKT